MESITILSDDPDGIKSLIKCTNFLTQFPGLTGKGIESVRKIRDVFGPHTSIGEVLAIISENKQLSSELSSMGVKINHGI